MTDIVHPKADKQRKNRILLSRLFNLRHHRTLIIWLLVKTKGKTGTFLADLELEAKFSSTPVVQAVTLSGCIGCNKLHIAFDKSFDGTTIPYRLHLKESILSCKNNGNTCDTVNKPIDWKLMRGDVELQRKDGPNNWSTVSTASGNWHGLFGKTTTNLNDNDGKDAPIYVGGTVGVNWDNDNRSLLGAWIGHLTGTTLIPTDHRSGRR